MKVRAVLQKFSLKGEFTALQGSVCSVSAHDPQFAVFALQYKYVGAGIPQWIKDKEKPRSSSAWAGLPVAETAYRLP